MPKYLITVKDMVVRRISVEAEDEVAAKELVEEDYDQFPYEIIDSYWGVEETDTGIGVLRKGGTMKAKAVCVMRTDLRNSDGFKVPKGKLIAQGSHAFVGLITKQMSRCVADYCSLTDWDNCVWELDMMKDSPLYAWLTGIFTKIVLGVDSEEELLRMYDEANELGLNTVLITDAGHTEFSEPTITCIGIGPDWEENINEITGHLKGFS